MRPSNSSRLPLLRTWLLAMTAHSTAAGSSVFTRTSRLTCTQRQSTEGCGRCGTASVSQRDVRRRSADGKSNSSCGMLTCATVDSVRACKTWTNKEDAALGGVDTPFKGRNIECLDKEIGVQTVALVRLHKAEHLTTQLDTGDIQAQTAVQPRAAAGAVCADRAVALTAAGLWQLERGPARVSPAEMRTWLWRLQTCPGAPRRGRWEAGSRAR